MRLSNNIVHIRTCADSCKALADLIRYFAVNGDLGEDGDWKSDSTVKSRVAILLHWLLIERKFTEILFVCFLGHD